MNDTRKRQIEQMVEKFCDDYCGSVDCYNCGVSAENVMNFLNAEWTGDADAEQAKSEHDKQTNKQREFAKCEWIPVKWHEIKDAEREEEGYPKEWVVIIDSEMPSDEQEILVTTQWGTVSLDVCCEDGEFSLESGWDWIEDIIAWMPLPEPYRKEKEQ